MIYYVCIFQGVYFLLTGAWAIFSIRTFQMVTGPKVDLWLVKTVGALVALLGLTLIFAGFRATLTGEIVFLAVSSAFSLAAVDVIYVVKKVISPIYLLDAVGEILLVVLWALAFLGGF